MRSFVDAGSLPDDLALFKEGINQSAEDHAGFPTDKEKLDALVCGKPVSIMFQKEVTEEESWIDVYYEAKRYRYSPVLEKWAEETAPPHEKQVIRALYEMTGRPVPEGVLDSMRDQSLTDQPHGQAEKSEKKEKTAEEGSEDGLCGLESVLRALLPPDGDLALKQTKSYIAVTFNGSRKWMCRFYLKSRKSKYIEFPDGRRFELDGIKDIAHYKEQLVSAYIETSPKKGRPRPLFPTNGQVPSRYSISPAESRDNAHFFSRN